MKTEHCVVCEEEIGSKANTLSRRATVQGKNNKKAHISCLAMRSGLTVDEFMAKYGLLRVLYKLKI